MRSFTIKTDPVTRRTWLTGTLRRLCLVWLSSVFLCLAVLVHAGTIEAQRVAVLSPDKTAASSTFTETFTGALADRVRMVDAALAEAAFVSAKYSEPFNMTTDDARRLGAAIGCDYFILLRSATIRRSSSKRPEYYESTAPVYVVSTRTGRLVLWRLQRFEAATPGEAEKQLAASAPVLASAVADRLPGVTREELDEKTPAGIEEVPEPGSPAARDLRAPVPYRRLKPAYSGEAAFYEIKAVVDVEVDLDAAGEILRTQIVRWAGYGLDDEVVETVRHMNWRPAMRAGKPLPMRFLLRYNFKKIEKDQ